MRTMHINGTSLVAQMVKRLSAMWETRVQSLGQEGPWRRKLQFSPVLLPGKSHGQRSLLATVHRVAKSQTQLSDLLQYIYLNLAINSCLILYHKTQILGKFNSVKNKSNLF